MGRRPPPPPRLNLDRHGMPKDYATYMWVLYREVVEDRSPARLAFLQHRPTQGSLAGGLRDIAYRMQCAIYGLEP